MIYFVSIGDHEVTARRIYHGENEGRVSVTFLDLTERFPTETIICDYEHLALQVLQDWLAADENEESYYRLRALGLRPGHFIP